MPTHALLVSHGQPSEPQVAEAEIAALAEAISTHLPGWTVVGATLAADGALEAALARAPGALVYPMFMADGWFTQTVLPRRLGDQAGPILPPFGLDPRLPALADSWLRREIDAQGWTVEDTAVFVAGHGSGRSARPAEVTYAFGQALEARLSPRVLRCGFVEQPPFLAPSCDFLGPKSIALPFFAAKRGHVLDDLPEAMNAVGFTGLRLEPIGLHPEVPKLIAESLQAAAEAL